MNIQESIKNHLKKQRTRISDQWDINIVQRSKEISNEHQAKTASLWNPDVAAYWSIPLTPIFGALVHARNWRTLGYDKQEKLAMNIMVGGTILMMVLMMLLGMIRLGVELPRILRSAYFIIVFMTVTGYVTSLEKLFASAKEQKKYIKEHLNDEYKKKNWVTPMIVITANLAVSFILSNLFILFFLSVTSNPLMEKVTSNREKIFENIGLGEQNVALTDISAVWRGDTDGAMITLRLAGEKKSIDINGKTFLVTVKNYDDENEITTLIVNNNPAMIWTIQRYRDESALFITLHEGTQDKLSFVRKL